MKKVDVIWRSFNTAVIVAILLLLIFKQNQTIPAAPKNQVLVLRTVETFDSTLNRKGTKVYIDTLSIGKIGSSSVTIWNDCPEKKQSKKHVVRKNCIVKTITTVSRPKDLQKKKVNNTNKNKNVSSQEEIIKNSIDTCLAASVLPDTLKPDTLKLEVLRIDKIDSLKSNSLFKQTSVLPTSFSHYGNKIEYNYDVKSDYKIKEYWPIAKKHLIIGGILGTVGTLGYTATMLHNVPTFVQYNGFGYFDPANKYYQHNLDERQRLKMLKWARGVSIGVGVLGGIEIIHGTLLLKKADFSVSPQTIKLTYKF